MGTDIGERFAKAIAAKDAPGLLDLLDPQVDFRAMTPGRFWEHTSADEVVRDVIFGKWFEPTDHIDALEAVDEGIVVGRHKLEYRLRVTNEDGPFTVEQRAYFDVTDDRITWLRIMCSGYLPLEPLTA